MKPLHLRARNLRTFPELDLELGAGVVGILGELRDAPEGANSNGAGKSTILEAIDIALFGRRSLASYLTRGGDVDELMVELTFEHGGETYRIRRTFSARGRGKTNVDLERFIDSDPEDNWEPLTRASAKETDQFLCDLIGLSKETFRDSSYLRQGDGGYADPGRDPRQRKQLLVEAVLGRDPVWPRLAELAKGRRKVAEQQLERYRGEAGQLAEQTATLETFERGLGEAERAVVTAQDVVSQAEQRHADIATRYQAAREQGGVRATLEAELATARAEFDRLDRLEAAAAEAVLASAAVREELAALSTAAQAGDLEQRERLLVAQLDEHSAAVTAYDQALRDRDRALERQREILAGADQSDTLADQATAKAVALEQQEQPVCQTCGQHVDGEARDRAIAAYRAEINAHVAAAAAARAEAAALAIPQVPERPLPPTATLGSSTLPASDVLVDVRAQLDRAREQQAQRARLEERLVQLQRDVEARPPLDTITAARDVVSVKERVLSELEPVDLAILEQEGKAARVALETARTVRESAIAAKARCEERLATIRAAQGKLAEIRAATEHLEAEVDRDVLLERAYGRDGIPALIIENTAIPSIEAEASRILRALGTSMDVQLRTQAETKTGALRDTLEVVVIKDGCECEYETGLSEGEKTRVALALRIGLARLLRHRASGSEMLALDEPSYLDAAGMAALLNVLREIEASGEFSLVFLVSHVAELRDSLEQTITVIQENGVSRIDGAPVREEVAA